MRLTLLLFFSFIYCTSNLAQLSLYNIADYARPDLERRTANIDFDMDFKALQQVSSDELRPSLFDIDLNFSQSKFVNSTRHQINASNYLGLTSFDDDYYNRASNATQRSSLTFGRTYNRKTFDTKQGFWELGYAVNASASNQSLQQKFSQTIDSEVVYTPIDYFRRDKRGYLSANISRGRGRIELVSDAWHAKTILEMLKAKGLAEGELSPATIQAFAEKISDIKNTRNTDFRLERISEHEALNEFVQSQDWAKTEDFRFFPTLLDAWDYEAFRFRWSGKEFKYGLQPSVSFSDRFTTINSLEDQEWQNLHYRLQAEVAYNTYTPISDNWQFNNRNSLRITPTLSHAPSQSLSSIADADWVGVLSSSWEWQFLPNLRSYYTLGLNGQLTARDQVLPTSFSLSFNGQYVHYFSPKFNIRIDGSLYIFDHFDVDIKPHLSESLAITTSYRFY